MKITKTILLLILSALQITYTTQVCWAGPFSGCTLCPGTSNCYTDSDVTDVNPTIHHCMSDDGSTSSINFICDPSNNNILNSYRCSGDENGTDWCQRHHGASPVSDYVVSDGYGNPSYIGDTHCLPFPYGHCELSRRVRRLYLENDFGSVDDHIEHLNFYKRKNELRLAKLRKDTNGRHTNYIPHDNSRDVELAKLLKELKEEEEFYPLLNERITKFEDERRRLRALEGKEGDK